VDIVDKEVVIKRSKV